MVVVVSNFPTFNSTPALPPGQRPLCAQVLAVTTSGLPSPSKSATASVLVCEPPALTARAFRKVPSPFPNNTPTAPPAAQLLPYLAVRHELRVSKSGIPSPFTSAAVTPRVLKPPEP